MSSFNKEIKKYIEKKKRNNLSSNQRKQLVILEKQLLEKQNRKTQSASDSKLSGLDRIGKNVITMEKFSIRDWINKSNDNCAIIIKENDKQKVYLIERGYIESENINNVLSECVVKNNQLLVQETFKSKKEWLNVKYILGTDMVVNLNDIKKILKKNNIIELSERFNSEFISKELLRLSHIGLTKQKLYKNSVLPGKINLPYNEDVYFEDIIEKALYKYSFQWDAAINNYLRFGETYFDTPVFKQYQYRYGDTYELACQAIRDKIVDLDRAFLEAAPRNENDNIVFYRGMKEPFQLANVSDTEIIQNYISISKSFSIALQFSGIRLLYNYQKKEHYLNKKCCMYQITLDKGLPFINMINTTKFKKEKEILLPRNLIFTLTGVIKMKVNPLASYEIPVLKLHVSSSYKDQFKIKTGCYNYTVCNIRPITYKENPVKFTKKNHIENVNQDVKNNKFSNIKRCPNGTRKNKETGECDKVNYSNKTTNKSSNKLQRCPNGMRRNPKTKECELKL
tara:strand:- start:961 stop:2490 length:1530 start_codon:yes stop_codon:yes gene_type:complete